MDKQELLQLIKSIKESTKAIINKEKTDSSVSDVESVIAE